MKTRPELTDRAKRILTNFALSFLILIALITLWAGCTEPTEPQQPVQAGDCIELDTSKFYFPTPGGTLFPQQRFRLGSLQFAVEFIGQTANVANMVPPYWRIEYNGSSVWIDCIPIASERITFYGVYSPDSICGWARHVSGNTRIVVERATAYRVQ
jgi:hypothetical protein